MTLFRQVLVLLLVASTLYGGYVAYGRLIPIQPSNSGEGAKQDGAVPVEVAVVRSEELSSSIEAVGTTRALKSVEIVPQASGRVDRIAFRAGDEVKAGDILVELDADIEAADLAQAKAALVKSNLELERAKTLRQNNIAAKATVDELVAQVAAAEAAVAKAERRLADRTVRAPFGGMVGMHRLDVGARTTDSTVLTTLDDLSSVLIEFSVPERLFGATHITQKVEATTAAYPGREFEGKVVEVDSRVDAVSRSFKVRAEVPNAERALPAGMFMHIRVILDAAPALVIPEEAVVAEASGAFVFVVEDNRARRQKVVLGRRGKGVVEVIEGLGPGARVVTRGTGRLRDGAPVELTEAVAETRS
jgi:membrane fusion protein (multidrug efflux system)